ncbi:hypothetical protein K9L27_03095 [Candidatus Gracilibacteria bacterium]|nr:hypothetical protein [Candidatus Gracilibacteria bacterium]
MKEEQRSFREASEDDTVETPGPSWEQKKRQLWVIFLWTVILSIVLIPTYIYLQINADKYTEGGINLLGIIVILLVTFLTDLIVNRKEHQKIIKKFVKNLKRFFRYFSIRLRRKILKALHS